MIRVEPGDCRDVIKTLADNSIDSCVTDPPYSLISIVKRFGKPGAAPAQQGSDGRFARASAGFVGQKWDTGEVAHDPAWWAEVYRVLKPGAHLVAFGGTRTFHRLACAIEDAGFEIRDCIFWCFGSGFPKSHSVSKAIDKDLGAERRVVRERYTVKRIKPGATVVAEGAWGKQDVPYTATDTEPATAAAIEWDGWGTALKPALEPICLARKPLSEKTVAANVLRWGTGALNIDGCRIQGGGNKTFERFAGNRSREQYRMGTTGAAVETDMGRWPANLCHDGSDEVLAAFPGSDGGHWSGETPSLAGKQHKVKGEAFDIDGGTAARFFYSAKADKEDRFGSRHPTVKPVDLMRWLARLVTPPGGTILEPFAGSGTTGVAALAEGFDAILIEREAEYLADIGERLAFYEGDSRHSVVAKNRNRRSKDDPGPLFSS